MRELSSRFRHPLGYAVWALVIVFLVVGFVAPLTTVLVRSMGDPFYQNYVTVLGAESTRTVIFRTLRLGALVTLMCAVLAYPTAYAITQLSTFWRGVTLVLIILPFLTSFLVRTYGWIALLGANGLIASAAKALGFQYASLNGTLAGLAIAMTHMLLPLMVLPLYSTMISIDRRQLSAAGSLGASPAEAFIRVYLPQSLPGLYAGIVLVFIMSLGFFITPALIGGTRETTVSQVIFLFINQLFDWKRAASLAVILLAVVAVLFLVSSKFVDLGALFGMRNGSGVKPVGSRRRATGFVTSAVGRLVAQLPFAGAGNLLANVFLLVTLLLLVFPLFYVVLVSFQPLRMLALPTTEYSLVWYQTVLSKVDWLRAARNSLLIASIATATACAVGYLLAKAARNSGAMRYLILALALGPLALPQIVLALGIYGVFLQLQWTGSVWAVGLAHAVVALPYAFINIANGLATYDTRLDNAAASLGAKPWIAFLRVKFPLLRVSLATAAAFAFLTSFDELIVTLFIAGPALPTLPVRMWAATRQNLSPELAVVGTVLIVLAISAFTVVKLSDFRRNRKTTAESTDD